MSSRYVIALVSFLLLLPNPGSAGERWWVFFTSKPVMSDKLNPQTVVSERSLRRRAKVLPIIQLLDERDFPVDATFIGAVKRTGASVVTVSRWLNAVSVEADESALEQIRALPFVHAVQPVRVARRKPMEPSSSPAPFLRKGYSSSLTDLYGPSLSQNSTLNAIPLHELGIIGKGVLVGIVDDGFINYRTHAALQGIDVIAAYDFVQRDADVSLAQGEWAPLTYGYWAQGYHGAGTLSTLAGYDPGSLIGPAFGSSFALAKTEIDSVEIAVEEDNYVEGIEWLDSVGVDIISSSLGYIDWYTQDSLDGMTTVVTKIARTLASKGVLLVTAMGNEGNYRPDKSGSTGTMIAPADADSVLSVGAVGPTGVLTSFSSTGPTADGRIKPEVVAQGSQVQVALWTGQASYDQWQGTSLSTPLVAAAAALVLSAHPDATPMQLRASIIGTAQPFNDGTAKTSFYPNNFYGWGHVNAYAAALALGPIISNIPLVQYDVVGGEPSLIVSLRAASSGILDMTRFAIYARRTSDSLFTRHAFAPGAESGLFSTRIPVNDSTDTLFVGYITYADQAGPELRRPIGEAVFELHPTPDSVASYFPPADDETIPVSYALSQNFPNPFNPGTTILFRAPRTEHVDLSVYDMLGRKVRTLFSGTASVGRNVVTWARATDDQGHDLPSGVYIFRLSTTEGQLLGKMMFLK